MSQAQVYGGVNSTNMADSTQSSNLPPGVYVPMLAFFRGLEQSVDIAATQRHAANLIHAGVAGLVLHGSNGEAAHLSRSERIRIIKAVVDTVRHEHDRSCPFPVIAGCSAQSVCETVDMCREAAGAGATQTLILPPSYYAGLLSRADILAFFRAVARQSDIPLLIYNFPKAAAGIDLTSDDICELADEPNIAGVKLTCGNTGKLARVVVGTEHIRSGGGTFFVAGGSADFILQGAIVGTHGTISGLANLCPRMCLKILAHFEKNELHDARGYQGVVAAADWLAIQTGFVGVKAVLNMFDPAAGDGRQEAVLPRLPCSPLAGEALEKITKGMYEIAKYERKLRESGYRGGSLD